MIYIIFAGLLALIVLAVPIYLGARLIAAIITAACNR